MVRSPGISSGTGETVTDADTTDDEIGVGIIDPGDGVDILGLDRFDPSNDKGPRF